MMKKVLVICVVFLALTHVVYAKSAELLELKGFKEAVKNVHYLAKVKITNVEILRDEDEYEKHVYSAEVLATYHSLVLKEHRSCDFLF
ncbi:hypothetical protein [Pseudoalteromonas rhizosphaerae]|uniref:hypothetical protein n=1 Tax=Pseudoalteromonas rhizosphaerae TaxID=2518973 RepID=UPI001231604A|nr:hypothetical protein [Pseudoalteromonas rhizosphaerae]